MSWRALAARWAALIACAAIVARYAWIAHRGLAKPISPGLDVDLAVVWLGIAFTVIVSSVSVRSWRMGAVWLGLAILVPLGVIVVSGQSKAALIVAWMLVGAWGSGDWVIRAGLKSDPVSPLVSIALGLGLLGNGVMALGAVGRLTPAAIAILLAVMTFPVVLRRRHLAQAVGAGVATVRTRLDDGAHRVVAGLIAAACLFSVIWGVTPEIQFDALNYHLTVGRDYLEAGRIVDLPHYFHSYFAHLGDMLFMVGQALDGPIAAKLLSVAWGLLATAAVYVVGRMAASPRVGAWAAALYYLTPLISWEAATANVDGAVAFLIMAAIVPLARWLSDPELRGAPIVAAAVFGVAVGTKLNALWAAPAMAVLTAVWMWRRTTVVTFLKTSTAALAVFVLLAGPTYLRVYALTGSPVFPLYNSAFRSDHAIPPGVANARLLGTGTDTPVPPRDVLRLPYTVSFDTSRFGTVSDGILGATWLLALPFGVFAVARGRPAIVLLLALTGSVLVIWGSSYPYFRFLVPVVPAVPVLAAAGVDAIARSRAQVAVASIVLGGLVVAQGAAIPPLFWNLPERVPWRVATGQADPQTLLRVAVPGYAAIVALNAAAQPGDLVLASGMERARYYIKPAMVAVGMSWNAPWLSARIPAAEMALRLRQAGVQFLMVDHRSNAYRKDLIVFSNEFRDTWTDLISEADGVSVRRIRD